MNSTDNYFGVSLSIKTCRDWQIDDIKVLKFAVKTLDLKHFRLMSYWNEIEKNAGKYDFSYLDRQFNFLEKNGCHVSLAVGKRQPRWPECHIPAWALRLPNDEWQAALLNFIEMVVKRYKDSPALLNYQLENEALLKKFGHCPDKDYSRRRFKKELKLIKKLDPSRPVIMSLSNNWGLPIFGPFPDVFAMSVYRIFYKNGGYVKSIFPAWWYKARAKLIKLYSGKTTFVHELQTEPWGPKQNYEMPLSDQDESMNLEQLKNNIEFAKKINLYPIYTWGLEWWYVRSKNNYEFKCFLRSALNS